MDKKIDLKEDESFRSLLMSERAALLARVDAIEIFLAIEQTKNIRSEAKRLKHEAATNKILSS